ncbi:unnamed protein product [Linum trigynum]|uniref:C2H2-type domain-containing protein n=1 Tax=Linum trigynum TaxID=586398 RepID=A0AAV2FX30_9ROSI
MESCSAEEGFFDTREEVSSISDWASDSDGNGVFANSQFEIWAEARESFEDSASEVDFMYKIRNLDDGREFVFEELDQAGIFSRLRELGSDCSFLAMREHSPRSSSPFHASAIHCSVALGTALTYPLDTIKVLTQVGSSSNKQLTPLLVLRRVQALSGNSGLYSGLGWLTSGRIVGLGTRFGVYEILTAFYKAREMDFKPSRMAVIAKHVEAFIREFFAKTHLVRLETGGSYMVALDECHFKELLLEHAPPPPALAEFAIANLIKMGFPQRVAEGSIAICSCHREAKAGEGVASKTCFSCWESLLTPGTNKAGPCATCTKCKQYFCLDCDIYIHESLHNCPSCESRRITSAAASAIMS